MRQLCSFDGEIQAQQFAAYLFLMGITTTIDVETNADTPALSSWVVWILEEDDLVQAQEELDRFLQNPGDPCYANSVQQAGQQLKKEAEQRQQNQKKQVNMQSQWKQRPASSGRPLTMTLLLVCVGVFLFSGAGELMEGTTMRALQFVDLPAAVERAQNKIRDSIALDDSVTDQLDSINKLLIYSRLTEKRLNELLLELDKQNVPSQASEQMLGELIKIESGKPTDRYYDLKVGQVWRVVTPIFIHLGIMHLVFNMIWLYQLGGVLEGRYKSASFGGLVLFTGIAGVLAQCCMPYEMPFDSLNGGVLGGGMSGVVFGLLGFAWIKTRSDPASGLVLRGNIFGFMMIWLVLGFSGILDSLVGGHIANWAHGGGLVAGMLLGYLSIRRR